MAIIATIPQTTIPAGPVSFGPGAVASNVSQYLLTLNQVAWPHAGDLAFSYTCDVSQDGGNSWATQSSSSVDDSAIPARNGLPANQERIACDIPGVGNANRKIRFSAVFAKSLTVSGTLQAL